MSKIDRTSSAPHRPIVVLSHPGSPEGALNLARSMRSTVVPILLVSEGPGNLAALSRHVHHTQVIPDYSRDSGPLRAYLRDVARDAQARPVVVPTSDSDLWTLMRDADAFASVCDVLAPEPDIGMAIADKSRFAALAAAHDLPVPKTFVPAPDLPAADIAQRAVFPVIVKPSVRWDTEQIDGVGIGAKAIRVDDAAALLDLLRRVDAAGYPCVVQEFIPGGDDQHLDLQAFVGRDGQFVATFTSCKRRLLPVHNGAGCYVESVDLPDLVEVGVRALRVLGLRGISNIDFKRHALTGKCYILEINPRLAHWNIFSADCGVNLPWLAYREVCGEPLGSPPAQVTGRFFLDLSRDVSAFRQYRREGTMNAVEYVRSLCRPWATTYQNWRLTDPAPFLVSTAELIASKLKHRLWLR